MAPDAILQKIQFSDTATPSFQLFIHQFPKMFLVYENSVNLLSFPAKSKEG